VTEPAHDDEAGSALRDMSAWIRDGFVTPQRERLAEAARHLIDAVLTSEIATEEQLGTAADMAEAAARHLGREPHGDREGVRGWMEVGHADYLPRSPLVGEVSPLAPPIQWEFTDGRIIANGVFTAAYEGPPGYVHGGWVALTFDEILGMANIASGHPGMTGTLKIRYLRPTPLHTRVELEGWTERVEGRRIVAMGRMLVNGEVTAEAEGLFVMINEDMAMRYFGRSKGEAAPAGGVAEDVTEET
jgi:acyl-coenzyme A thioesterase PaaI-like protein